MSTQPKTSIRFDRLTFERLRTTVKNMSAVSRARRETPSFATAVPEEIGVKLNNSCNLRCTHCFEWNETGFHRDFGRVEQRQEIDINVIARLLEATEVAKSKLFLWGGEPLLYTQFSELASLLERDRRWTTICSNATYLEPRLDDLLRISDSLAFLASVDGLRTENDAIRGPGTFDKVVSSVQTLLELQRRNRYKGKVSILMTISDSMAARLYEFLEFFEAIGVDSVYLTFPWYLTDEVSKRQDAFVQQHFPDLWQQIAGARPSWHSFDYHLSEGSVETLIEEMRRIADRIWRIRPRFHPALEPHEVRDFVLGKEYPAQNRSQCLAISDRIDVLPNGDVTACKLFPEMAMGNLGDREVLEVWHHQTFSNFRSVLSCGLMPVCSKCTLLYSNGC